MNPGRTLVEEAMTAPTNRRVALCATAVAALLAAAPAAADTFTVTNAGDPGQGSLRQAIQDANARPGPDSIRFASGVSGAIKLARGDLAIRSTLDIVGPGVRVLTVSGQRRSRVFVIAKGAKVRISDLAVSEGVVHGSDGSGGDAGGSVEGGGILNDGALTLERVEVSHSKAEGGSGGNGTLYHSGGPGGNAYGGGIASNGTLVLVHTLVIDNHAAGSFGGDAPRRAFLHAGEGGSGWGGGIRAEGELTIRESRVLANKATGGEGGADNYEHSRGRRGGEGNGGGVANRGGTAGITGSVIDFNTVRGGPGPYPGHAYGAGIRSDGGGGALDIDRTTVADNSAIGGDGYSEPRPLYVRGGGILNRGRRLVVLRSTISGNSVHPGKGANDHSAIAGGGISNLAGATLVLTASTVGGNRAEIGGGIENRDAVADLTADTVADNGATQRGGGANLGNFDARASARDTLVARLLGAGANCAGTPVTSHGFNLEQGNSCGFGAATDQPNTNPRLGPLKRNGGPTKTQAIPESSPAVDQGVSAGLTLDQRGMKRPVSFGIPRPPGGDGSDIGAFELQAPPR